LDLAAGGARVDGAIGGGVLAYGRMPGRALVGLSRLAQHSPPLLDRPACIDPGSRQMAPLIPAGHTIAHSLRADGPPLDIVGRHRVVDIQANYKSLEKTTFALARIHLLAIFLEEFIETSIPIVIVFIPALLIVFFYYLVIYIYLSFLVLLFNVIFIITYHAFQF